MVLLRVCMALLEVVVLAIAGHWGVGVRPCLCSVRRAI